MSDFLPVRQACEFAGSLTALAKHLGVAPPIVHRWATGVQEVPIIRCVEIEKMTKGAVTRQRLRPNDWEQIWPELVDKLPPL